MDDMIDPGNLEALREALGHNVEHTYPLKLPNGKKLPLVVRECGIAELMEASNGEKSRGPTADFSSRSWRRQAIKKLNVALKGFKFVDDFGGHRPNLENRELPFSLIKGDDFNALMELAFPGFLAGSEDIRNRVNEITNEPVQEPSSPGYPPGSGA